jgi:hypothetical protein
MAKLAEFTVTGAPEDVAEKALQLMQSNVPEGTNLKHFNIRKMGPKIQARAEATGGTTHNSVVWVDTRPGQQGTVVELHANDGKSDSLIHVLQSGL